MRKSLKRIILDETLTVEEFADFRGVTVSNVRQRVRRGTLPAVKRGNVWLIDVEDLNK